jgi:tol-pal system protein YbgF
MPAREREPEAPLMAPPGAVAEPREGEAAAPDPLVSEIDRGSAATPSGAETAPDPRSQTASGDGPTSSRAARASAGDAATYRPPVIEDGPQPSEPSGDVPADAAGVLYSQLQDLRQEVMMLRGLVEAQGNLIDRLEREQRERYLDLDRRVSRLAPGAGGAGDSGGGAAGPSGQGDPSADPASVEAAESEEAAYEQAFALTREKRFEEAIPAFRSLIETWPDGAYVPNAWYWLGELHLALPEPDLEQARQAFVQVIQLWPEHQKVPDALYKLGVVYDRLGESSEARRYLERTLADHPQTPAARLARSYLEQMQG